MLQKFHCEHVLQELNDFGCYQKYLIFGLIMPMAILTALQTNFVYNELVPDHWCRVECLMNFSYGEQHRLIRPRFKYYDPNIGKEITRLSNCEMFDIDYAQVIKGLEIPKNLSIVPIKKCSDGWTYNQNEFKENAAMHYNFVCDQSDQLQTLGLVRKLSSALFSLIYAILSDRYGRKIGLLSILFVYVMSAISPVLTTNYYAFIVCQALNGSTWPIGMLICIIFGIEFVTPEYRSDVLALAGVSYHFGEWLAYLMAEALPHWVWITICKTIFVLPFFLFYQYCDESPQWLLATKQFKRLKDVFQRINRINSAPLDQFSLNSIIKKFSQYLKHDEGDQVSLAISMQNLHQSAFDHCNRNVHPLVTNSSHDSFVADSHHDEEHVMSNIDKLKLFIKRSTLFQMIFLWAIILICNELIIDFMSKRKSHFDENVLIDRFLTSLIKMPIILLAWYLVNQCFGRRWSNCIILSLNLILLISVLFGQSLFKKIIWLNVSLSVLAIMLAECSELITILQTLELTSTRYRVLVVSIVHSISQLAVLTIIYYLYNRNLRPIFTTHTKLIFICCVTFISIILASFVAETRNEFLPLGVLESEQLITNFNYWSLSKEKSDIAPSNLFLSLSKWDINANHQIVGSIKHLHKFTDS